MDTLEEIGRSESTTFVLPQELTSMVGRYGKHLSGGDVRTDGEQLESLEFDDETRELIGLDDIAEIIGEIEDAEMDVEAMEQEAQAIKEGEDMPAEGGDAIDISKTGQERREDTDARRARLSTSDRDR